MKRIEPALIVIALLAGCGASQSARSESREPSPVEVEPAASAAPEIPSREAVIRAINSVMDDVAACGRGAHGAVSVTLMFDSSGAVADAFINPEYTSASAQPGPGCDATPDARGYYDCRRPHTPMPDVDDCIVRAARAARVPPFTRPTFRVNYPFRY